MVLKAELNTVAEVLLLLRNVESWTVHAHDPAVLAVSRSGSLRLISQGPRTYWTWLAFLGALIVSGALAYGEQLRSGLIVTAMRDQVSWGFYIGNFTFLVGVAAAAVVLVIPAYVYDWKPIREIVIYGELLAISAIVMCLMFVVVDIGRPDRAVAPDSASSDI